jgi:uroporphyrinogen-III synthase
MASIAWRQGMRALVTRPREEAEALASALAARGVGALIEPMMQVHFRHAILNFTGVQAVLCTSANGVRALARASAERAMPLLAVGDATAVASAGGAAADLARLAAERLRPQDGLLLHVCGSVLASDLAGALGAHGFAVERSVLYSAQPVAAFSLAAGRALSAGEIDFALFFSPRTAAVFVRLAEAAGVAQGCKTATALSISAAADKALDPVPWAERRIAERPNQAALLDKLDGLLAERRRG